MDTQIKESNDLRRYLVSDCNSEEVMSRVSCHFDQKARHVRILVQGVVKNTTVQRDLNLLRTKVVSVILH